MGIYQRAHPDFLHGLRRLFFSGLLKFLAVIELELPVIHDLTDRRISLGSDFYKIQLPLTGYFQCRFNIHDADLPFIGNDSYLFGFNQPDLIVYAGKINDPFGHYSSLISYCLFLLLVLYSVRVEAPHSPKYRHEGGNIRNSAKG
jgi:hypothetical protein